MSGPGFAGCCSTSPFKEVKDVEEYKEFQNIATEFLNELFRVDVPFTVMEVNTEGVTRVKCLKNRKKVYDENIKFSYYGNTGNCNNHDGIITVCSTIVKNEVGLDSPYIIYGVSFCSPEDVYNKEIGKSIAYDDMQQVRAGVDLVKKNHHDINTRIFADMIAHDDGPSWAKKPLACILIRHIAQAFDLG